MLRALHFAWRNSVRQPGRTVLGVLGVAAVGALLFDMLLLSHGLVLSFRDLLDRAPENANPKARKRSCPPPAASNGDTVGSVGKIEIRRSAGK